MSKGKFDIKTILDIPRWEAVQDQLAKATGTAIITIDYKGTPITKHSMRTDFCNIIRENPISRKRCQKCDSLAGLEAVRLNQPFIYLCHCGIVDVAVPITVGDQYLGAVMFGQVRISNGSDAGVERLVNEISSFHTDNVVSALQPDMRELYQRLPEMEYERIRGIAEMINAIVQYIVARAVDNRARMMSYEWRLRSLPGDAPAVGADAPVEIHALTSAEEHISAEETVQKSSVVYPAVVYIEDRRAPARDDTHARNGIALPPEPQLFFAPFPARHRRELHRLRQPPQGGARKGAAARHARQRERHRLRARLFGCELFCQALQAFRGRDPADIPKAKEE